MKQLIIYHKEDNDGVFSAALMARYITKDLKENLDNIHFFGADYNELNNITKENIDCWKETYNFVAILDISFNNVKLMKYLYDLFGNRFIWCDHHKPIIMESYKLKFSKSEGIRDTAKSTILCVYQYLWDQFNLKYDNHEVPELLRILSGWDSWSFDKEGFTEEYCQKINTAITHSLNLDIHKTIEFVNLLFDNENTINLTDLYNEGSKLLDYDLQKADNIISFYGDLTWTVGGDNNSACALFTQGPSNSIMFRSLKDYNIKNGIIFKRNNNSTWTISLYNINDEDDFDCGKYLKDTYKGGGHKGAAGCTVKESKFIKILKTKHL